MKPFFTPEPVIFFSTQASKKYPGNTIKAVEDAFLAGADVVCLNIQLSKDNIIMAISETMIDNLCNSTGPVSEFNLSELKSFDAGYNFKNENGDFPYRGKGYKFMTLEEVLEAFPDKRFNFTLMTKEPALAENYIKMIKKHNAEHRVLTSSLFSKNIKMVRSQMPESATAFTLTGIIGIYALFKSGLLYFFRRFKADALQTPEAIGVSYIANGALIDQMHSKGVKVHVWDVKDRFQLKRVYEAGADGFMVNDIQQVKDFLDNL